MEPEVTAFLRKVAKSIFIGFTWLAINAIAAIKWDSAFVVGTVTWENVLFYTWFVASVIVLVIIFRKMWFPKAA